MYTVGYMRVGEIFGIINVFTDAKPGITGIKTIPPVGIRKSASRVNPSFCVNLKFSSKMII